jgi:hypothetical protein
MYKMGYSLTHSVTASVVIFISEKCKKPRANYSVVRGRTQRAGVRKNTATLPLHRGGIQRSVWALPCKLHGVLYRIPLPLPPPTALVWVRLECLSYS